MLRDKLNKFFELIGLEESSPVEKGKAKDSDKSINTSRKTKKTYERNANKIYESLQEEMAGPTGQRIFQLLFRSCARTPMTKALKKDIIRYIHSESMQGRRSEAIAKDLMSMLPGKTSDELIAISRTVIGKCDTARVQAQSEDIGIVWYVWRTSEDGRVRPSHRLMNDVLIKWMDPPSPEELLGEKTIGVYHAGEAEECRCYAAPVVDFKYLTWPHKVFNNGQIVKISKSQFAKIM